MLLLGFDDVVRCLCLHLGLSCAQTPASISWVHPTLWPLSDLSVWWVLKPCTCWPVPTCAWLVPVCCQTFVCLCCYCCCCTKTVTFFTRGHQNEYAIYTWSFLLLLLVSFGKYFIPNASVPDPLKNESATQATASFHKKKKKNGTSLVLLRVWFHFCRSLFGKPLAFISDEHAQASSQVFQKRWPQLGGDKRQSLSRSLF